MYFQHPTGAKLTGVAGVAGDGVHAKYCHALNCKNLFKEGFNLCEKHQHKAGKEYKIYKSYQEKNQRALTETLSITSLKESNVNTLNSYYTVLVKIIRMREEYTNKYFLPSEKDKGHEQFITGLENRLTRCVQVMSEKYQEMMTTLTNNECNKQDEQKRESKKQVRPTSPQRVQKQKREDAKDPKDAKDPIELIEEMSKAREDVIRRVKFELNLVETVLKRVNGKITDKVITDVLRFFTFSLSFYNSKCFSKKFKLQQKIICTCGDNLEIFMKTPELLHIVCEFILRSETTLGPLINELMASRDYESCRLLIYFAKKDENTISAFPCVSTDFDLDRCPTLDLSPGQLELGSWPVGRYLCTTGCCKLSCRPGKSVQGPQKSADIIKISSAKDE